MNLETEGNGDVVDITRSVAEILAAGDIAEGIVTVFVPGSTASVTTLEFEPGLQEDLPRALARIAPPDIPYAHDKRWGDGNGRSHVAAAIMGPGLVVPFKEKKLLLGTWQQIVLVDHDTRPRDRTLIIQALGD